MCPGSMCSVVKFANTKLLLRYFILLFTPQRRTKKHLPYVYWGLISEHLSLNGTMLTQDPQSLIKHRAYIMKQDGRAPSHDDPLAPLSPAHSDRVPN